MAKTADEFEHRQNRHVGNYKADILTTSAMGTDVFVCQFQMSVVH